MARNYLSIPKLQRSHRWSLGIDKYSKPTNYNRCNYLTMQGLKLTHVSKRGHWRFMMASWWRRAIDAKLKWFSRCCPDQLFNKQWRCRLRGPNTHTTALWSKVTKTSYLNEYAATGQSSGGQVSTVPKYIPTVPALSCMVVDECLSIYPFSSRLFH